MKLKNENMYNNFFTTTKNNSSVFFDSNLVNTKLKNDMFSTVNTMEQNYQNSLTENIKMENANNNQKTENSNKTVSSNGLNQNLIKSLLSQNSQNSNSNELTDFLLKNIQGNENIDKFRLMQELLSQMSKNSKKQENNSQNKKEIDTSNFVKTSDYHLD